uniref:SusC/RagA family TonB-linked outer membrane protein n=1 Tax=Segatella hominis TaxID=2518605 RepID=UPI0040271485
MEKRLMTVAAAIAVSTSMAFAQSQISGKVTSSEDGSPVIGASIKVAGTNTGTVTDIDGNFSLNAPAGSKLEISYIGMVSKTVKAGRNLNIVMDSDNHSLDEVMVVAFGTAKKSAFTGSAAVVGSEELSKKVTTNVADALVGSVPGLQLRGGTGQPGDTQGKINIRGIASMYASTDPLIIVDGAPYSASLSNIPTEDIESVSILKDAASAALYGARGAAGVIIVTTKKGSNKEAKINVDMKWGSNSRAIPDYDVIKDPGQYYEAYYAQLYNRNFYGRGQSAEQANLNANKTMLSDLRYNVFTYPDNEQLIGLDGKINPHATLGRVVTGTDGKKYLMTPDDWANTLYNKSLRQEYNVSANGGTDRSTYYTSVGYLKDDGIIQQSGYERLTARLKADYQAKKWLKLGTNVGFVTSNQTQSSGLSSTSTLANNPFVFTSTLAPIYPLFIRDENGNIMKDDLGNDLYDFGSSSKFGIVRPVLDNNNPMAELALNRVTANGHQLNASMSADIQITSFLKANLTSTLIWGQTNGHTYSNAYYGPKASVNGELQKESTESWRQNHTQTLTYYQDFGKHSVTVLLGHEYYKTNTRYLSATGQGGFTPSIQELAAFAKKLDSNSYRTAYNVEGYFGNAQYSYDDKYFGSFSYRRDASSRFAKDHRWGNFWSIGGAWLISKESWFKAPWVDELKIKASIGQQGNDNIGNWAYIDLYTLSKTSDTSMAASFARIGNKNITWETTTNLNIGTEFSFFNRRLSGTIDFYSKKTTDLLFWLSIPESAGSRGYYGNVGDIRNNGIEVTLTGSIIRTKDLDWSVTANIAHNSTKILKLPESKIADNGGFNETSKLETTQYWYRVGGPLYNGYMPKYAGVNEKGEATYWVDEDAGGGKHGTKYSYTTTNPNSASKYETGSLLPKAFGGFSTTVVYKGFDFTASFDYQIGGKVYDSRYASLMSPCDNSSAAGSAIHKDYLKSWSPNNTSSNIPRWQYGDNYTTAQSDRFLTNASYFNFQSFTVGYSIPTQHIPFFSKIRVYCSGENLGFISARKGLDPRYSYDGGTTLNAYSPVRNISGGIQLTF